MSQPDEIPRAFRNHFARHNREATLVTIITLVAAVLLWTAVYILIYGLLLLFMSALRGTEAGMPKLFLPVFGACALLLCLLAWIARKIRPGYFPVDRKPYFEVFMDIVLMLPRITLAVWGNYSARQVPTERELRAAWRLLQTIGEQEHRKINMNQLPLEIPKPRLRARVVFLLQLVGLVDMRRYHDGLWLVLQGKKARRLVQTTVKINPELPGQVFE